MERFPGRVYPGRVTAMKISSVPAGAGGSRDGKSRDLSYQFFKFLIHGRVQKQIFFIWQSPWKQANKQGKYLSRVTTIQG